MFDVQASDFVTIGLLVALEGLLSADNAMVLAVLVLGLPRHQQQKALRYGIIGAFVFRIIATLLAVVPDPDRMGASAGWPLYLLYLRGSTSLGHGDAARPALGQPGDAMAWAVGLLGDDRQGRAYGHRLRRRLDPRGGGDVEQDWVVITGGVLGIIAMRLVVGQLLALVQRYPALVDGAFVIIAWVGVKLLLEYLHNIHIVTSRCRSGCRWA